MLYSANRRQYDDFHITLLHLMMWPLASLIVLDSSVSPCYWQICWQIRGLQGIEGYLSPLSISKLLIVKELGGFESSLSTRIL